MPYDASRDAELFTKSYEDDMGKIVVSVHSYNNGPLKLQITRQVKDKEGQFTFAKMGRLSKDETEGILPLIQEALGKM